MTLFSRHRKTLVGMIHLAALPGSPRAGSSWEEVVESGVKEALLLKEAGFDAILVENMHDRPYLKEGHGPELAAGMAVATRAIREATGLPCGIQILAGADEEAVAAALVSGASFIRAEGFAYAHVADEGWIDGCAGELLRYRQKIGAEDVSVLADIKKKHSSHAVTADVSLGETAKTAEFLLADGVIVTGSATGEEVAAADLDEVRGSCGLPVIVGSGASAGTVAGLLEKADAAIVGSSIKKEGHWENLVCPKRARAFVAEAKARK